MRTLEFNLKYDFNHCATHIHRYNFKKESSKYASKESNIPKKLYLKQKINKFIGVVNKIFQNSF